MYSFFGIYTHDSERSSITKYSMFKSVIKSACVLISPEVCIYADQSLLGIPDRYDKIRYTHGDVMFKQTAAKYKRHELKICEKNIVTYVLSFIYEEDR